MHHDVLNKLTVLLGTRREKGIIWSRLDIAVKSDQKKSWQSIQNSNLDIVNNPILFTILKISLYQMWYAY